MKAKSTLVIVCLALAFLMTVGTTAAQAQSCCCYGQWVVGAPFFVTLGAMAVMGAIVTAPFSYLGCSSGNCGFSMFCNFPHIFPKCNE
jgi:hypothetical protein